MNRPTTGEFDLIEQIRARAARRGDVVLGIGDDAAILRLLPGCDLVVAMDTFNAGVHFPVDTAAGNIGWKALAVNLSDLAAMGATPAWCTLSLSLPDGDAAWVDGFLDGFLELAELHDVSLVGGDTTRGPLSICVTAHGFVPRGEALRRDAACVGDDVWVSGCLGDAAAALALLGLGIGEVQAPVSCELEVASLLQMRLDRPRPRVALGTALRTLAHACIDVSDGLIADLGHVCRTSGVGAVINTDSLPASVALRGAFDVESRRALQATGGDDYELCFTAPAELRPDIAALSHSLDVALARIGRIVEGSGVIALDGDGAEWKSSGRGYQHFD